MRSRAVEFFFYRKSSLRVGACHVGGAGAGFRVKPMTLAGVEGAGFLFVGDQSGLCFPMSMFKLKHTGSVRILQGYVVQRLIHESEVQDSLCYIRDFHIFHMLSGGGSRAGKVFGALRVTVASKQEYFLQEGPGSLVRSFSAISGPISSVTVRSGPSLHSHQGSM